jgi:hypothetical protein
MEVDVPDAELQGTVVTHDPKGVVPLSAADGLYLHTDDGRLLELISHAMPTQMPIEVMWRQSRGDFEPYLGQRITVKGYLSRRQIYSAEVIAPAAGV